MWHMQFGKYSRVDKRIARKLYNEGKDVFLVPCNLRPDNSWGLGHPINKDNWNTVGTFDTMVAEYEWYNCRPDTGRYVAFYKIREE